MTGAVHLEFSEDEAENPALFLLNPWNGKREVIARFFWPLHPPEVTSEAESLIEQLGRAMESVKLSIGGSDRAAGRSVDAVICDRCKCTKDTYSELCSADLSEKCPGFISIEGGGDKQDSTHLRGLCPVHQKIADKLYRYPARYGCPQCACNRTEEIEEIAAQLRAALRLFVVYAEEEVIDKRISRGMVISSARQAISAFDEFQVGDSNRTGPL